MQGATQKDESASFRDDAWVRRGPSARQRRNDVILALALAVGVVVSVELARSAGMSFGDAPPAMAEQVAWALAIALPLAVRRRFPLAVLACCSTAYIGLQARYLPEGLMTSICLFLALYTAGAWGTDRRRTGLVRGVVVGAMFTWLAYGLTATAYSEFVAGGPRVGLLPPATASLIYLTAANLLYFAAAWVFGDRAWASSRQRAQLIEHARELEEQRAENARRAVLDERVRIARELHDVVAHHVSVMGIQAGAARRVLDRDPPGASSALRSIEATGRTAVDELRRLLGVLRDGGQGGDEQRSHTPAPGLDQLPDLIAGCSQDGLQVDLAVVGEARTVPASVAVSVYRVTQEALTNTMKHAAARKVDVRLRYLPSAIEVEVVDDGQSRSKGSDGGLGHGGMGHGGMGHVGMGHVGMRERLMLHDGELEIGPRAAGGYRVRARFPVASS